MPLRTALTELLGLRAPLVQGGMQWVGTPSLAAAVSDAGALGILTALTQPSPDALRVAIRDTRARLSPEVRKRDQERKEAKFGVFGVNITLLPSINPPDYEGYARAAIEEGVRIFETAGNNREYDENLSRIVRLPWAWSMKQEPSWARLPRRCACFALDWFSICRDEHLYACGLGGLK